MTYTLPSNSSDFVSLFRSVNTMVGADALAIMMLIIIFFIVYILSSVRLDTMKCVAYSSWICTISAIFLRIIFSSSELLVLPFLVMSIASVLLISKKEYE